MARARIIIEWEVSADPVTQDAEEVAFTLAGTLDPFPIPPYLHPRVISAKWKDETNAREV